MSFKYELLKGLFRLSGFKSKSFAGGAEDIVARAGEAADMKWEEEKLLIAKWEDQRRTILESARMA